MIRRLLRAPLCAVLRLFFRRIEVAGREHLPDGPVVFILNHPNALIDPLLLLCRAGRPVSFLAKEPLFRMPVIGWIVRGMDAIPVYRRMDQADTARNAATFDAARRLLARGGSLALFPEGTSHSDPRLKPFRTGAARIALGAAMPQLRVVPVGLFYTEKARFRSSALLCFGAPLDVRPAPMGDDGEPASEAVRGLTTRLEEALGQLTLQADHHDALRLVESAERIVSSATDGPKELAGRLDLRRRLLDGYAELRQSQPARVASVEARIEAYWAALRAAALTPELLPVSGYHPAMIGRAAGRALVFLVILLPVALVGAAVHVPAWVLVHLIGARFRATNLDMVSTVKALAGLVFYPVTWLLLGWLAWRGFGPGAGLAALVAGPVAGFVGLRFAEELDRVLGGARGLVMALTGRRRFLRLVAERKAIREELAALGEMVEGG